MAFCTTIAVTVLLISGAQGDLRSWTDNTGQYKVEAQLVGVKDGLVQLERVSGSVITIPLERLSETDQQFVRSAIKPGSMVQADSIVKALSLYAGSAGDNAKTLERAADWKCEKTPLEHVVADISNRYNMTIVFDRSALESAGISLNEPVSCDLEGAKTQSVLSAVLTPLKLTCHYKYEVLWITTPHSGLVTGEDRVRVESGTALGTELGRKVEMNYLDVPFDDVLRDLSKRYGVRFVNDTDSNPPLVFSIRGVSLRSALALLLHTLDLCCEVEGGALVIRKVRDND